MYTLHALSEFHCRAISSKTPKDFPLLRRPAAVPSASIAKLTLSPPQLTAPHGVRLGRPRCQRNSPSRRKLRVLLAPCSTRQCCQRSFDEIVIRIEHHLARADAGLCTGPAPKQCGVISAPRKHTPCRPSPNRQPPFSGLPPPPSACSIHAKSPSGLACRSIGCRPTLGGRKSPAFRRCSWAPAVMAGRCSASGARTSRSSFSTTCKIPLRCGGAPERLRVASPNA